MTVDHRLAAQEAITQLTALLKPSAGAANAAIVEECEALGRAIAAFHMEGIRFRMYNVDRLVRASPSPPEGAVRLLEDARKHLEEAGFHTRSHQSPV
jgi:hypothetical protein